jgi:hypothetical protein
MGAEYDPHSKATPVYGGIGVAVGGIGVGVEVGLRVGVGVLLGMLVGVGKTSVNVGMGVGGTKVAVGDTDIKLLMVGYGEGVGDIEPVDILPLHAAVHARRDSINKAAPA